MVGMVKDFFDRTYEEAKGKKKIFKNPYVVFISAGNDGKGVIGQYRTYLHRIPIQESLRACDSEGGGGTH